MLTYLVTGGCGFIGSHLADALLAAMARSEQGAARVLNGCTGQATTIVELAVTIGGLLGRPPNLQFAPPRVGDIRASLGDPQQAAAALGLNSTMSLRDGLA